MTDADPGFLVGTVAPQLFLEALGRCQESFDHDDRSHTRPCPDPDCKIETMVDWMFGLEREALAALALDLLLYQAWLQTGEEEGDGVS